MIGEKTPPIVSMPRVRGVTSNSSRPWTAPASTPAWRDAPIATHSSGLMPLKGSLPVTAFTASCTAGMRVEPPTSSTFESAAGVTFASSIACRTGPRVASMSGRVSSSNFSRVRVRSRWQGVPRFCIRKGIETWVSLTDDSSILACSAASRSREKAVWSFRGSRW